MPKDTIIDPEWELEQQRRLKETLRGTEEFASGLHFRRGEPEEDVVVLGEDVPEGAACAPAGSSAGTKEEEDGPDTSGASAASPDREDDEEASAAPPSRLKEYIGSLLSGNILSKSEVRRLYPYLLFVAFLMLLYISNVFRMQHLHRRHDALVKEVKELRAKSLTISAMRMNSTRQSEIIRELEVRGIDLQESLVPPKVIGK